MNRKRKEREEQKMRKKGNCFKKDRDERGGDICASDTTFPITEEVRGGSQNPRI
jgi:hypothetical protein